MNDRLTIRGQYAKINFSLDISPEYSDYSCRNANIVNWHAMWKSIEKVYVHL